MTNLTVKQRAKINAALCIIHDNDGDAGAVTAMARTIMATGHDARTSYEKALNSFAAENPAFERVIGKMVNLIEASSTRTVAAYDIALSDYIATGNNAGMVALAPTIAKDSIALAIHNGEMTEADVATGGLAQALGFEPGSILQSAYTENTTPAIPTAQPGADVKLADMPAHEQRSTDSQVSVGGGQGAGHVTPKTQAIWNATPVIGRVSTGPATLSLPASTNLNLPGAA